MLSILLALYESIDRKQHQAEDVKMADLRDLVHLSAKQSIGQKWNESMSQRVANQLRTTPLDQWTELFHSDAKAPKDRRLFSQTGKRFLVLYLLHILSKLGTQVITPYWYTLKKSSAPGIRLPRRSSVLSCRFDPKFNTYDQGECSVIFADAKLGGGTFRAGASQEEVAMLQCFQAALFTAYVREVHSQLEPGFKIPDGTIGRDEVVFMTGVQRIFDLSRLFPEPRIFKLHPDPLNILPNVSSIGTCYVLRQNKDKKWVNTHATLSSTIAALPSQVGAFILMDAANKRHQSNILTDQEIEFMLRKALLGFTAAQKHGYKQVSTGGWGAGDFNVNLFVSLSIQMAAAHVTGLDGLVFYGIKENTETVRNARLILDALKDKGWTLGSLVQEISNRQGEMLQRGLLRDNKP